MTKVILSLSLCLASLFTFTGCVEDEVDITLKANGSGTVTHKVTLSKQLVQQMEQMKASGQAQMQEAPFPTDKDQIKTFVGDAFKVTSTGVSSFNGKKTIEFSGNFDNAEKFFASEYGKKLGLNWKKKGAKTFLHIGNEDDDQMQVPVAQLYAMAKGLYVRRSITLPNAVSGTKYGKIDQKNRRVTWEMDLRNDAGLKKTTAFVEGPAKGKDKVLVKGKLKFKLPYGK